MILTQRSSSLWLAVRYLAWAVVQSFQWEASPGCSWLLPRHSGLTWALSSSWSPSSCYRFLLQGNKWTERSVSSSRMTSESTQCGLIPEEESWHRGWLSTVWCAVISSRHLALYCLSFICVVSERSWERRPLWPSSQPEQLSFTTCSVWCSFPFCTRGEHSHASGHFLSRWSGLRIDWKRYN